MLSAALPGARPGRTGRTRKRVWANASPVTASEPPGVRHQWLGMSVLTRQREGDPMGSVIKKRRKRMAKKKHRKLLKRTRVARRNKK
ncbi:hypothetical protein BQ8420_31015 [Nocardiopsis sp. JB363]|nr:hypothetical protein BQ8420_31015 [Nocardiopsis sp. JB363]